MKRQFDASAGSRRRTLCVAALASTFGILGAGAYAQSPGQNPAPSAVAIAVVTAAPVIVRLETTAGPIVLELNAQAAPRTVANFVQYVKDGFYAGTIFHRVIAGFMVQGGGYTAGLQEKPTRAPIAIESNNGLKNVAGTIAMARTADPNSATAQFFINVVDNPMLDYPGRDNAGYTVFGRVIEGMDTVEKIRTAETTNKAPMFQNIPVAPVIIKAARLGG